MPSSIIKDSLALFVFSLPVSFGHHGNSNSINQCLVWKYKLIHRVRKYMKNTKQNKIKPILLLVCFYNININFKISNYRKKNLLLNRILFPFSIKWTIENRIILN